MILYRSAPQLRWPWLVTLCALLLMFVGFSWWQKDWWLGSVLAQPITITPHENFVAGPVTITMSTPLSGTIRYTVDGTAPDESAAAYTQPFQLDHTAIVQAAVFHGERQVTTTQRQDFFVDTDHTLPVLSINLPPEGLWDDEIGIYVEGNHDNYRQTGEDWERRAWLRWYEPDHTLGFEQLIGLRLHGNAMRSMPQKSFRIYVRDEQGREKKLTYPLFGENGNRQHSSFVLRNGGSDQQYAFMRDRLASELVEQTDSNLDTQSAQPVVLYLNGQYWGLYYARERFDETYFTEKYQVDPEALSIVSIPLNTGETRGQAEPDSPHSKADAQRYNRLLADVRRCTECASYSQVANTADINNLVDYFLFEFFYANFDWPYNNAEAWRYRTETLAPVESQLVPELDGRFRWLLFDVDVGFGAGRSTSEEMVKAAQGDPYANFEDGAFPFRNFFSNPRFQQQWVTRVNQLTDTTLSEDNLLQTVDQLAAEIRPEMARHIARWSPETAKDGVDSVDSVEEWERRVALLKDFLRARPAAFREHTTHFIEKSRTP
jgi:hypothetical protein